jgi:hypothetical protein
MASYDLCGTAQVHLYLQKGTADTGQTAVMAEFISRASIAIINFCGREFAPAGTAARPQPGLSRWLAGGARPAHMLQWTRGARP